MSYNPGSSSNKEVTSQYAHPRPVSYIETTGAVNEFGRKLRSRQLRLEPMEASQGEEVQPNDANMSSVSAELWGKTFCGIERRIFGERHVAKSYMASKQ